MVALRVCSLFTGIGGFEVGLEKAGFETVMICDNDPAARAVLNKRFSEISYRKDVTELKSLPSCDVLVAGWPCQDLSQAGRTHGIGGTRSTLINEVFRLLEATKRKPRFVILENVAFSLHLHAGRAIRHVTDTLQALGYHWAYRILDTREFGLPQRRRRIFIVGALDLDPTPILFDGTGHAPGEGSPKRVGFYWTEGNRGIGWTPEAVPPLKGGSGLSIPSPPAIWDRASHTFFCPGIIDAERLQGFSANWTLPVTDIHFPDRVRWRLIGNAVSVPIAHWIGKRLKAVEKNTAFEIEIAEKSHSRRPNMGRGGPGRPFVQTHLEFEGPAKPKRALISDFAFRDSKPLSLRAASGFLERLVESPLHVEKAFKLDLARYTGRLELIADKAA
jgi:DNA (cytosine-5)-methyltransferase 1